MMQDAVADSDGDGLNNKEEIAIGTIQMIVIQIMMGLMMVLKLNLIWTQQMVDASKDSDFDGFRWR